MMLVHVLLLLLLHSKAQQADRQTGRLRLD